MECGGESRVQERGSIIHSPVNMKAPYYGRSGLSEEEFNRMLDHYLLTGRVRADEYARLNRDQETIIQAIKRSIKRIAYKLNHD